MPINALYVIEAKGFLCYMDDLLKEVYKMVAFCYNFYYSIFLLKHFILILFQVRLINGLKTWKRETDYK